MGCLIFLGHFPQKNPIISGSFAERDLQFEISSAYSPLCKPRYEMEWIRMCVVMCCSVLQCGAVWCSVVQCGALCCSVLQRVAVMMPLLVHPVRL